MSFFIIISVFVKSLCKVAEEIYFFLTRIKLCHIYSLQNQYRKAIPIK